MGWIARLRWWIGKCRRNVDIDWSGLVLAGYELFYPKKKEKKEKRKWEKEGKTPKTQ